MVYRLPTDSDGVKYHGVVDADGDNPGQVLYGVDEHGNYRPVNVDSEGNVLTKVTGSNVEYLVFDIDRDKNNRFGLDYGKSGYGTRDTFSAFESFFIYAENNTDREQEVVMRIYYKGSEDVRVDIPIGVVAVGAVLTKEIHAPFKDFIFRIIGNSANSGTFSTVIFGGY